MSIAELTRLTGVPYTSLFELYHGRAKRVDLKTLNSICRALNVQPGDILEYAPDHEALEPARRILATPVCQSCGMRHEPGDKSSCIEGHGEDPVHGVNCPIAQTSDPMSCTCDDEPVPFRGQIGTGF